MQLLFIKPLLEDILGISRDVDYEVRYDMNPGTLERITSSRYNIVDMHGCCTEMIELFSALKCLPILIGTEEECNNFESSVRQTFNNIKDRDILWAEPLKQAFTDNVAAVGVYLSNRAILKNGKSFQRATEIPKELLGCNIRDYRILNAVTKFSSDEIPDDSIKNYARRIANIIEVAQYNTIEYATKEITRNLHLFDDGEKWIACKMGGGICVFGSMEKFVDKVIEVAIDNDEIFNTLKIIGRSKSNLVFGHWSTNTGIWRIVKNNSDMIEFVRMFENEEEEIEIKIMEG